MFRTAIDYLVALSLPALAISLAGPEQIVNLLFGTDFTAAAPALPVLMGALVVVSVGHLTGTLIIVYGLQRLFIAIALGALAFNVGANLALVPPYGFMAAAWVTLATEMLVLAASLGIVCRRTAVWPNARMLGRIALAASLGWACAFTFHAFDLPTIAWVALGGAAYAISLFVIGALRRDELVAVLRPRWREAA